MCKRCVEAVDAEFPGLTWDEKHDVLWGFTPFPFGGPEDVVDQLREGHAEIEAYLQDRRERSKRQCAETV